MWLCCMVVAKREHSAFARFDVLHRNTDMHRDEQGDNVPPQSTEVVSVCFRQLKKDWGCTLVFSPHVPRNAPLLITSAAFSTALSEIRVQKGRIGKIQPWGRKCMYGISTALDLKLRG